MPFRPEPGEALLDHLMPLHGKSLRAIVAGAVGKMGGWRRARARCGDPLVVPAVTPPGQDVAIRPRRWRRRRSRASRNGVLDRVQAIVQHRGQHAHEAPIGFVAAAELAPQSGQGRRRRIPVLEGRARCGQGRRASWPGPAGSARRSISPVLASAGAKVPRSPPRRRSARRSDRHRRAPAPNTWRPWPSPSSGCGRR